MTIGWASLTGLTGRTSPTSLTGPTGRTGQLSVFSVQWSAPIRSSISNRETNIVIGLMMDEWRMDPLGVLPLAGIPATHVPQGCSAIAGMAWEHSKRSPRIELKVP